MSSGSTEAAGQSYTADIVGTQSAAEFPYHPPSDTHSHSGVALSHLQLDHRLVSPRPRSDAGSATARYRLGDRIEGRAGSQPFRTGQPSSALAVAKHAQENLKRQLESLEEKFESQILRVQQHGDRHRDAAFNRLDTKMSGVEAQLLKFDRKLAELSGNYKGLSEEMQAQIRRLDSIDTKLWEWRHQVDEENRNKFAEVEQHIQQQSSQIRLDEAKSEDAVKRLASRIRGLDSVLQERLSYSDETHHNLELLFQRVHDMEAARLQEIDFKSNAMGSTAIVQHEPNLDMQVAGDGRLANLEAKIADSARKLDHTTKEAQQMHVRMETQEEKLRSLRTLVDSKEDTYRNMKLECQDWESRAKEFQANASELEKHRVQHGERLDVYNKRFENMEDKIQELHDHHGETRKLQEPRSFAMGEVGLPEDETSLAVQHSHDISELEARLVENSGTMVSLQNEVFMISRNMEELRSEGPVGERMQELLKMLKEMVPTVTRQDKHMQDQEKHMQELNEKVGKLDAKVGMWGDHEKTSEQEVGTRVGHLEAEVKRIKAEIEGTEPDSGGCH